MKILFTNNTLGKPAGTELAIRDLCLEMRRRGHLVAAYSTHWGEIATSLIDAGVAVLDDPAGAPWTPEVIHGHHEWETTVAAVRWPNTPVLSFCRGLEAWQEAPCRAPNVVRWVAIDEPCLGRLTGREKIPSDQTTLILNGIDLSRFQPRSPLPAAPRTALLFSNYATPQTLFPEVSKGCAAAGVVCEAAGTGMHRTLDRPEETLGQFDIVFAKGKAALEAAVTGCAVVVCDIRGLGPLVTAENFEELRRQSFGYPCMTAPVTPELIQARIQQWNAASTAAAQHAARETCGILTMFDRLESLYLDCGRRPVEAAPEAWTSFAADFLSSQARHAKLGREIQEIHRQQTTSPSPATPFEASKEFHRIVDAYRKGQQARAELRRLDKEREANRSSKPKRKGFFS